MRGKTLPLYKVELSPASDLLQATHCLATSRVASAKLRKT